MRDGRHCDSQRLFDNFVTVGELLSLLEKWFRRPYTAKTVYNWVSQGMPHEKIRGRIFVSPEEVATWLRRS